VNSPSIGQGRSACPDGFTSSDGGRTEAGNCYKSCSQACTQQTCPANAYSCTHGTTVTTGTQHYGASCTAAPSTCTLTVNSCKAGYYKDGNACTACPAGYTSPDNTSGGIGSCYITVPAGKYLGTGGGSTFSTCIAGTAKAQHTVYYGATSACDVCAEDTYSAGAGAASCTACPTDYRTSGTTANDHNEKADCKIYCAAGTQVAAIDATCSTPNGNWYIGAHTVSAGSVSKPNSCPTGYSIGDNLGATYHDQKDDCTITCAAGTQVAAIDATCSTPNGSWYTATHTVSAGYTSNPTNCATGYSIGNNLGATYHDERADCKITCKPGTQVAIAGNTCSTPTGAWYTTDEHIVSEGDTSKPTRCLEHYYINGINATNHDESSDCLIDCPAGTYLANANDTTCTDVGSGYYMSAVTGIPQGSTSTRNTCPVGNVHTYYKTVNETGSFAPRAVITDCYQVCQDPWQITGGEIIKKDETTIFNVADNAYNVCLYSAECDSEYYMIPWDRPYAPLPICNIKVCPEGSYCDNEGNVMKCPDDGKSSLDTRSITGCYKTMTIDEFGNGTGMQTCYYDKDTKQYSALCKTHDVTCDAGYFYSSGHACNPVDNNYYSPATDINQHQCPAGFSGSDPYASGTNDCYHTCELSVLNSVSVKPVNTKEYFSGTMYPDCIFDVVCQIGYHAVNDHSPTPTCEANIYTITLDRNGGKDKPAATPTPADISCQFNSGACTLPTTNSLLRPGYVSAFKWCTAPNGGGDCYEAGAPTDKNISANGSAITLYAQWTPVYNKVYLDDQDATTAVDPTLVYLHYSQNWYKDGNGAEQMERLTTLPTKTGYIFAGYYSEPNGGGVQVIKDNGDFIISEDAVSFADLPWTKVYAAWTPGIMTCPAGQYYKEYNICETCLENHYCPGGDFETDQGIQGLNSCDSLTPGKWTTWTIAPAGSSSPTACQAICEDVELTGGVGHIVNERENYPALCQYIGESDTKNPCEIVDDACIERYCNPDYELIGGTCVQCNRENAITYRPNDNCAIATCITGYHPSSDARTCEENVRECTAPDALRAEAVWDPKLKTFGKCEIKECIDGYHISSNTCVVDERPCTVEHGIGVQEWNPVTNSWGECIATSCEAGYTNDSSLTNERNVQCGQCRNKFSVLGEVAASSYIPGTDCEIASCLYQGELYNLDTAANECVPICDVNGYEDETGTMIWDPSRKKCVRTCKAGYTMW